MLPAPSLPRPPADAVLSLAARASEGPTLADLKALTLGHLEGGRTRLVLDLRAAGRLDRRALGTVVYVLAIYHAAGGEIYLRTTPDQRSALRPYASLFHLTEGGATALLPR